MEQKFRKASFVMEPYIEGVLKRDLIPYQRRHKGDHAEFGIAISNRRFREVVEDALSEKQKAESHSGIPVYSLRTVRNREKRARLAALYGRNGFRILKADQRAWSDYIG